MNNRNFIITVMLLLFVGTIAFVAYTPVKSESKNKIQVADFPKAFGEWTSNEVQFTERDYKILETRNLFMRDYKDKKGDVINLYVVYSQDNRKVAHPPELCLMGGGMDITNKAPFQLAENIKATRLTLERGDLRQLVVYWFKSGQLNTSDYVKQQFKVALGMTFGKSTSGALIRITAQIKNENEKAAIDLIKRFAAEIEPLIEKYAP